MRSQRRSSATLRAPSAVRLHSNRAGRACSEPFAERFPPLRRARSATNSRVTYTEGAFQIFASFETTATISGSEGALNVELAYKVEVEESLLEKLLDRVEAERDRLVDACKAVKISTEL